MVNAIPQNSIQQLISGTPTVAAPPQPEPVVPTILPEADQLACSGDPGAELAALATKTGSDEERAARTQRDDAMKAEANADQAEVQDMHDKANLQRVQGVVDGTMQIGEGLASVGAGLETAHAANERTEQSAETADIQQNGASYSSDHVAALQTSATALGHGAASSDASASWMKNAGTGVGAAEKMVDGCLSGAITDKDADAKTEEASATTFKSMADDAHDSMRDAADFVSKALDFYKEYVDTKAQTAMAAIRRA